MRFNEWVTKREDGLGELGSSGNLGIETKQDFELLANQLSQLKDRIKGLLYDMEPPKREAILSNFVKDIQKEWAA
jgi:hypothetical protein